MDPAFRRNFRVLVGVAARGLRKQKTAAHMKPPAWALRGGADRDLGDYVDPRPATHAILTGFESNLKARETADLIYTV